MQKYRSEYTYTRAFGMPRHTWSIIGAAAGLHLHISDHGDEYARKYGERYSGGVEIHYRYPPDYMRDQPPSHDKCWLLKCPCWHDGSSLQASEFWIPFWLVDQNDHDRMFEALANDLNGRNVGCLKTLAGIVTDRHRAAANRRRMM